MSLISLGLCIIMYWLGVLQGLNGTDKYAETVLWTIPIPVIGLILIITGQILGEK